MNIEKTSSALILRGDNLWGLISVDQLKGAKIDVDHDQETGTTYQLVLVLEKKQEYFEVFFGWGDKE